MSICTHVKLAERHSYSVHPVPVSVYVCVFPIPCLDPTLCTVTIYFMKLNRWMQNKKTIIQYLNYFFE